MPNEMKYGNVDWPVGGSIAGERLATAGEYTGQHKENRFRMRWKGPTMMNIFVPDRQFAMER